MTSKRRKTVPIPSPDSLPFWEGCRRGELLIPFCPSCRAHFFYPRLFCPRCFGHGSRGADAYREAKARELIEDASGLHQGVVMGGDMNVGRYLGPLGEDEPREPTTRALVQAGYEDAHAALRVGGG